MITLKEMSRLPPSAATASACASTERCVERVDLGRLDRAAVRPDRRPPPPRASPGCGRRGRRGPPRGEGARHRAADRPAAAVDAPRSCPRATSRASRSLFVFGLASAPRLIGAAKEASASPRRIPAVKMIVVGIDPGTANTGYGVVARQGGRMVALDGGVIQTTPASDAAARLAAIHARVGELLDEHRPEAIAVEELYFGANVRSAFAVGQARGVVLLAAGQRGIPCWSYTPQQIKGAVCGSGRAAKDQVQRMVQTLLVARGAAAARPRRRRARRRDLPRQLRADAARARAPDQVPRAPRAARAARHDRPPHRRGRRPAARPRRRLLRRRRLPARGLGRDAAPGARRGQARRRSTRT